MPSSSAAAANAIRPATRADIGRVWELVLELAEYERLTHTVVGDASALERNAFDDRLIEIFVIEEPGEIVGYTISYRTFSTFRTQPGTWLEDLYVTPECRGKGYGKALLQNLIDRSRERGDGRLEWSVLDWNEPAILFYGSMSATVLPDWRVCRFDL
ncbi:GNAT family N-acetyltransferase [Fimbriimonas ginsengisoli]|uniref:Histone acetyltransferase HPA2 n=1 Tax=Fimbriimonas ginsengisoli Gsoil 348 TaxID=661478 RepID=A0A068NMK2_FIMGI|nr:GNAT family N-acetyltransferase [Fimbriimonas ginsengisoli]AIE84686.1 Histone acetyltransferase HPA2 [Fimbriimonas ginsengisoli Gsoil 348]